MHERVKSIYKNNIENWPVRIRVTFRITHKFCQIPWILIVNFLTMYHLFNLSFGKFKLWILFIILVGEGYQRVTRSFHEVLERTCYKVVGFFSVAIRFLSWTLTVRSKARKWRRLSLFLSTISSCTCKVCISYF